MLGGTPGERDRQSAEGRRRAGKLVPVRRRRRLQRDAAVLSRAIQRLHRARGADPAGARPVSHRLCRDDAARASRPRASGAAVHRGIVTTNSVPGWPARISSLPFSCFTNAVMIRVPSPLGFLRLKSGGRPAPSSRTEIESLSLPAPATVIQIFPPGLSL